MSDYLSTCDRCHDREASWAVGTGRTAEIAGRELPVVKLLCEDCYYGRKLEQ